MSFPMPTPQPLVMADSLDGFTKGTDSPKATVRRRRKTAFKRSEQTSSVHFGKASKGNGLDSWNSGEQNDRAAQSASIQ